MQILNRDAGNVHAGPTRAEPSRRCAFWLVKPTAPPLPTDAPRELINRMVERGVEILRADPERREARMRRVLGVEFNFDHMDLCCIEAAAGVAFNNRYVRRKRRP